MHLHFIVKQTREMKSEALHFRESDDNKRFNTAYSKMEKTMVIKESLVIRVLAFFKSNWWKVVILALAIGLAWSGYNIKFGNVTIEKQEIDINGK